jgi:tetratricopeptide (TPR) repeat protein
MTLGNLALSLQAQDRFDESAPLFAESLELRRRILGDRHPLVAQALLHLARTERLRGHHAQGLDLARQGLALAELSEGADHPHVAYYLREIGNNYMAQKDASSAEPYLRRMLDLRRRALSPQHPETARAEVTLAACLVELGRVEEAQTLLKQARATLAAQFGADDERVLEADKLLAAAGRQGPAG